MKRDAAEVVASRPILCPDHGQPRIFLNGPLKPGKIKVPTPDSRSCEVYVREPTEAHIHGCNRVALFTT